MREAKRHESSIAFLAHLFPEPGTTVKDQRDRILWFVRARDGACWVKGVVGAGVAYMHEAVVTRGDVQGWPKGWRCLIHVPYNCVILPDAYHNTELEPSRAEVADWMYRRYGEDFVLWLLSLPFRIRPPQVREWLNTLDKNNPEWYNENV